MDAAATAALWTTVGVILLAALAVSWYTHLLIRNKWRKRSLQFAQSLLDNADTIKEGLAAGYNFAECLVVLEAFYKARTPSDMLDSQSLASMIHKQREDSGVAAGTDSVPSSVYTRLRHLVGIDKTVVSSASVPSSTRRSPARRSQIELQQQLPPVPPPQVQLPQLSPAFPGLSTPLRATTEASAAEQLVECAVAAGFARHLAHQCVAQVQLVTPSIMPIERRAPPLRLLLLLERRRQEHAQFAAFERLSSVAEMGQPLLDKLSTQLGAPHAVLLSALYATAMSLPGTPRAMAGPPSAAHGHGHGHGRGRGHDCSGGGSGEGGRADALSDRTLATPSPLWSEQVERDEGEAVLGSFRRAEERWRQVRGFVPVLGAAHGPWQQQLLQRQLQAYLEAAAVFPQSDVQLEAELLDREAEAQPSADPRLAAGGELWRQRLWRRLRRTAQAREELAQCDALGGLLGVNADVVLHAVFDAGHDARTVVGQLRRYYDEHPQDAEAEVGVLPLWLEHALASAADAAKRLAEDEVPASGAPISSAISAAAFSHCASVAAASGKPAPGKASGGGSGGSGGGGSGGGGGGGGGAAGEAVWAAGEAAGSWWGLDTERDQGDSDEGDESGPEDKDLIRAAVGLGAAGVGLGLGLGSGSSLCSGLGSDDATDDGTASTASSRPAGSPFAEGDFAEDYFLGLLPDGTSRRVSSAGSEAVGSGAAPGAPQCAAQCAAPRLPPLVLPPTDPGAPAIDGAPARRSSSAYVPSPAAATTPGRDGVVAFGSAPPSRPRPAATYAPRSPPPSPPPSPSASTSYSDRRRRSTPTHGYSDLSQLAPAAPLAPSPPAAPTGHAAQASHAAPAAPAAHAAHAAHGPPTPPTSRSTAEPPLLMSPMGRAFVRASAPLLRHALVNGCPPGVLHAEACDWLASWPEAVTPAAAAAAAAAGSPPPLPEHAVAALLERVRRSRLAPPAVPTPPPPLWKAVLALNRAEVAHAWAEGAHWGAALFCLAAHYAENPQSLARRQPISLLELARRLESLSQETLDWSAPAELTHPRGPNRAALAQAARRGYPPLLAVRTLHECYMEDAALREARAPVPAKALLARLRAKRQLHKQTALH